MCGDREQRVCDNIEREVKGRRGGRFIAGEGEAAVQW